MCALVKGTLGEKPLDHKVIIVEGKTDRELILKLLDEKVDIVVTNGTLSQEKVENLILPIENEEVYVFVDADHAGNKLRKQLKQILPNARHLYTRKIYKEIATTPEEHLIKVLLDAHFSVKSTE